MKLTDEQILEGNKKIAIFEGKSFYSAAYHSSWEWLMPVVEKIRGLEVCENFNINITCDCLIETSTDHVVEIYCDKDSDTLQVTWMAVVKFLEWYNKNNFKA